MHSQLPQQRIITSIHPQNHAYGYQQVRPYTPSPAYDQFSQTQNIMIQPIIPVYNGRLDYLKEKEIEHTQAEIGHLGSTKHVLHVERNKSHQYERDVMYPKPFNPTLSQKIVYYFQSKYEDSANKKRLGNMGLPEDIRTLARSTAPQTIKCQNCAGVGLTRIKSEVGAGSWALGVCLCCMGCIPCAFFPCCKPECQDTQHYCMYCGHKAGRLNFLFDNSV